MLTQQMDMESIDERISALRAVGVPYAEGYEDQALADMKAQAQEITQGLRQNGFKEIDGIKIESDKQIIAIIAYLQRLGIDIKGNSNPFEDLPSSKALGTGMLEQQHQK